MKRTMFLGWFACLGLGCNAVAGTEVGRLPPTPPACEAGEVRVCYEGPETTRNVGVCRVGFSTCMLDGSGFGRCEDSVEPSEEISKGPNGLDDDCNGVVDNGIPCVPGTAEACYSGTAETLGVGVCRSGMSFCGPDGMISGPCMGEVLAGNEVPGNGLDDDCDGLTDTTCVPGTAEACYSGPVETIGVGICRSGLRICGPDGMGYGACMGEVLPGNEAGGDAAQDDDCNGVVEAVCEPGTTRSCYSGPANSEDIGVCSAGVELCNFDGQGYGECILEKTPSVELCTTSTKDENCDGFAGCTGGHVWSKAFGNAINHAFNSLALDAQENMIVTANSWDTIDFGNGPFKSAGGSDVVLAKFDPIGKILWSHQYGDASDQDARGVATDAQGNIYIGGSFQGSIDFGLGAMVSAGSFDVFIAKFDPNGNPLWNKRFGGTGHDYNVGLAVDKQGNVLLTGSVFGSADLGFGQTPGGDEWDAFLIKMDATGTPTWSKRFTGPGYEEAGADIAFDSANNVVVTGYMHGVLNLGGSDLVPVGAFDCFVVKFDSDGNHLWSRNDGGSGNDRGHALAIDSKDNVVLGGNMASTVNFGGGPLVSAGAEDGFVAKFTPNGAHIWSKRFGSTGPWESAVDLAVDAADNVSFVAGLHWGTADYGGGPLTTAGGRDVVVGKLDGQGNHIWSRRFGDAAIHQYAESLAASPLGNIYVAGYFNGSMDFGGSSLIAPMQGSSLYLAKLLP